MAEKKKAASAAKKTGKARKDTTAGKGTAPNDCEIKTAKQTKNQMVEVKEAGRSTPLIATVTLPPQYSALNVRTEPNGAIVGTLKNGESVTVGDGFTLENGECWRQIGEKQFVNEKFLKFK